METDFLPIILQALANLMNRDVPGALLVMSLALNAVLLAPVIVRYMRGKNGPY